MKVKFENNYKAYTSEIIYLKNSKEILINNVSKIKDNFENEIEFQQLTYNSDEQLVKGKMVKLLDFQKNFYKPDNTLERIEKDRNKLDPDFYKGLGTFFLKKF